MKMTREEAKERAEVMLSFAAGKEVQFFNRMSGQWEDIPGEVLWYLSVLAHTIGYPLKDIAEMNIKKVTSRGRRNKIHGDGDYR